jgi:Tfp pilus assembly protein PilF
MRRVNHALSLTVLIALALSGCTLAGPSPGGSPSPAGGAAGPNAPPAQTAPPAQAPPAPPRQFRVGAAAATLVEQAHRQAAGGDYVAATATLERALRIEPDNPLLWLELGRVRLSENNPAQADAMGRKALALATGDPSAQASAWRLIAEALRALGRNPEAADAERHAAGLATH